MLVLDYRSQFSTPGIHGTIGRSAKGVCKHPGIGSSVLLEIRDGLMKLIMRMDSLEGLFERVVERSSEFIL